MPYAPSRSYPAAPAGARPVAFAGWQKGAYAVPFFLTDNLDVSSVSLTVISKTEVLARATMAIFAGGAGGRPNGAALAVSATKIRQAGNAFAPLPEPVTLAAGAYFAATSVSWSGACPMLAATGGDLAAALALGTADVMAPASAIFLPPPLDLESITFTGAEAWQDVTDPAGAPLVWLGA